MCPGILCNGAGSRVRCRWCPYESRPQGRRIRIEWTENVDYRWRCGTLVFCAGKDGRWSQDAATQGSEWVHSWCWCAWCCQGQEGYSLNTCQIHLWVVCVFGIKPIAIHSLRHGLHTLLQCLGRLGLLPAMAPFYLPTNTIAQMLSIGLSELFCVVSCTEAVHSHKHT